MLRSNYCIFDDVKWVWFLNYFFFISFMMIEWLKNYKKRRKEKFDKNGFC